MVCRHIPDEPIPRVVPLLEFPSRQFLEGPGSTLGGSAGPKHTLLDTTLGLVRLDLLVQKSTRGYLKLKIQKWAQPEVKMLSPSITSFYQEISAMNPTLFFRRIRGTTPVVWHLVCRGDVGRDASAYFIFPYHQPSTKAPSTFQRRRKRWEQGNAQHS